jgi:hypothetical protein
MIVLNHNDGISTKFMNHVKSEMINILMTSKYHGHQIQSLMNKIYLDICEICNYEYHNHHNIYTP